MASKNEIRNVVSGTNEVVLQLSKQPKPTFEQALEQVNRLKKQSKSGNKKRKT